MHARLVSNITLPLLLNPLLVIEPLDLCLSILRTAAELPLLVNLTTTENFRLEALVILALSS